MHVAEGIILGPRVSRPDTIETSGDPRRAVSKSPWHLQENIRQKSDGLLYENRVALAANRDANQGARCGTARVTAPSGLIIDLPAFGWPSGYTLRGLVRARIASSSR